MQGIRRLFKRKPPRRSTFSACQNIVGRWLRRPFESPSWELPRRSAKLGLPNRALYSAAVNLVSWNVNGLRAVLRKNFLEYLDHEKPDVLCLQETKCGPDDVEMLWPAKYTTYWNTAEKKGYAGTEHFDVVR